MANRNVKQYAADAKTWATGHIVLAVIIGAALGFVLHAFLF
jgi:hypothetical protein